MASGGLVRLVPKAGREEELLARALDVAKDIRAEPGNLLTLVLREPEAPRDILMLELFTDAEAIRAHGEAEHTRIKGPPIHALLEAPMQIMRVETMSDDIARLTGEHRKTEGE